MNLCVTNDNGYISVYPVGASYKASVYVRLYVYDGHVCKFSMFYGHKFVDLRQGDYDAYVRDGMSDCEIKRMEQLINATAAMLFDPNESAEYNAFAITEALREIFREEI
jgi:hypothetical protein